MISPLLKELITEGVGEEQGGVSFAEIELDSPTLGGLALRYQVRCSPIPNHLWACELWSFEETCAN